MDKLEFALIFREEDRVDAFETFEDIQSELSTFGIQAEKLKGQRLRIDNCYLSFMAFNPEYKTNKIYEKIFTSDHLKKEYQPFFEAISKEVMYHTRPFQHLVEMVLAMKQYRNPIEETFNEEEIIEETLFV